LTFRCAPGPSLGESWNDLLRELPDLALVVGDIWHVTDYVVDPHSLELPDLFDKLFDCADEDVLLELLPGLATGNVDFLGILTIGEEIAEEARRLRDRVDVAALIVTMALQDFELFLENLGILVAEIARIRPFRDQL
jgi:hypothetical protein